MFSHVMQGVNSLEQSKAFYDAVLGTIGVRPAVANKSWYFYRCLGGMFAITKPINGGVTCEGAPSFREAPTGKIYLAYQRLHAALLA